MPARFFRHRPLGSGSLRRTCGVRSVRNAVSPSEGVTRIMTATTFKLTIVTTVLLGTAAAVSRGFTPPADAKPAAGERVADARQRLVSQNNLKRILIGFHGYHDKYGHLPHDIYKDGKAILSWRVAI